jgi:hypothetical protein
LGLILCRVTSGPNSTQILGKIYTIPAKNLSQQAFYCGGDLLNIWENVCGMMAVNNENITKNMKILCLEDYRYNRQIVLGKDGGA